MDKSLYYKIIEVLYQFMDLEVQNNLIWGHPKEYSTQLFKECGYEITDWSWYDGPIVTLKCTEHPQLSVNYAACANSYCIVSEEPVEYINVQVEEVPKLASEQKRSEYDFRNIQVKQQLAESKNGEYDKLVNFVGSYEFDCFVLKLHEWKNSFDKSKDYDYAITIYLGKEVDLGQV